MEQKAQMSAVLSHYQRPLSAHLKAIVLFYLWTYVTGWERIEYVKPCVTNVTIILFEKNFPPNVAFCQTDLFIKDLKKLPLSPATFVTNTRFAVLRKLTIITVTIVSIFLPRDRTY